MTAANGAGSTKPEAETVHEVLADLEHSSAQSNGQWGEKRNAQRRQLRVACTIRYVAPDGASVVTSQGVVRDIGQSGLSFVSRDHLMRGKPLQIVLAVTSERSTSVTGAVVYSRIIRDEWHLTGVRFEACSDDRITDVAQDKESSPARAQGDAAQPCEPDSHDEQQTVSSARDRALRLLNSATTAGISSKETVDKIIVLSGSRDHTVRRASIPALTQIGRPNGVIGLVDLLKDPNSEIQVEAAEALGHMKAETATEQLKELLAHKDPEVTLRVAAVLGRLNDRSGLGTVRRYLAKGNPHVRTAVRTLGIITGRRFRLNDAGFAEALRELKKLK